MVNGAAGTIVGVVLKEGAAESDVGGAVSAADIKYVVMDVPKFCGPVLFPSNPTWVPIEPLTVRHKRNKVIIE